MKNIVLYLAFFVILLSVSYGCKQSEAPKKAPQEVKLPGVQAVDKDLHQEQAPKDMSVHSKKKPLREYKVVIPQDVSNKWESVVLVFQDKESSVSEEVTVKIGDEIILKDSNLKIVVGYFIPDFKLDFENGVLTSSSSEPNNPAAGVRIFEGEKQIYPAQGKKWGWLYANFPDMHAFEHERYGLTLKGAIEKKG